MQLTLMNRALPLDSLLIVVPFANVTSMHSSKKPFGGLNYFLLKSGNNRYIFHLKNITDNGKIEIYRINGWKVFKKRINRGNSSIILPKILSSEVYVIKLKYGNKFITNKFFYNNHTKFFA